MSLSDVPAPVQQFLLEHVESYEQLEILLLLRSEAPVIWTEARLSEHLRLSATLTAEAVGTLVAQGLLQRQVEGSGLLFAPRAAEQAQAAAELARSYALQRLEIVKLMNANAIRRMRTEALRAFADAFVLRKDHD
jgi:hypothetical protein